MPASRHRRRRGPRGHWTCRRPAVGWPPSVGDPRRRAGEREAHGLAPPRPRRRRVRRSVRRRGRDDLPPRRGHLVPEQRPGGLRQLPHHAAAVRLLAEVQPPHGRHLRRLPPARHGFPGEIHLAKAENGWHHSKAFTLQDFHEPIRITKKQQPGSCRTTACAATLSFVHHVRRAAQRPQTPSAACTAISGVGHGERVGLGGPMRQDADWRRYDRGPDDQTAVSRSHSLTSWSSCSPWPSPPARSRRCCSTSSSARPRRGTRLRPYWSRWTEDDTDPAEVGRTNWPKQYDGYLLTAEATRTRFGGHGGSEACPSRRSSATPGSSACSWATPSRSTTAIGAATPTCSKTRRQTERLTKPQTGSCLHCHASVMPLYRELGDGDEVAGLRETLPVLVPRAATRCCTISGQCTPRLLRRLPRPGDHGRLRVTRPGFIQGIQALGRRARRRCRTCRRSSAGGQGRRAPSPTTRTPTPRRNEMRSLRLRPVPRGVLLLERHEADLPLGPGHDGGPDRRLSGTRRPVEDGERFYDYKHKPRRGAHPQGPAPRVRAVEPGHPRPQRRLLLRLPHALHARRGLQGLRPLGPQPAAQHQPRLPDLPPLLRGRTGSRASTPSSSNNFDLLQRRRGRA